MAQSTSSASDSGDVDPAEAFDVLVFENPRVCSGCFEHVRDIDQATLRYGRAEPLDVQDVHRTDQATLEPDADRIDAYGELESARARTTCRTCGRIGCWADDATLTQMQALRLTVPLADRLEEAGVPINRHALRKAVRELKSREEIQGYDTEIFRRATKIAINRA